MTGVQYGQRSTLGVRDLDLHIDIEDQVVNFPKYRRELINRLSGENFNKTVKSHKYEWSTRDNRALATIVNVGGGASITTIVVDDSGVLNVDDVFKFAGSDAQYVVESVGGGVNIVFRLLSGTQESVSSATALTIIGSATPQGKTADDMVVTPFVDYHNFTSILEDVVDLTGTQHASMIRGEENSGQLIARKQMELTEKLQRQLIIGDRVQDKSRKLTALGGLKYMIDTYAPSANAINFGGDIWSSDSAVQDVIDDALDIIAENAFEKPVMYVAPPFMRKFKYIQDDTTRTTLREKTRGIGVVKTYQSHVFGEIDVVQLQGMGGLMDDLTFLVDESQFGYKAMKGRGWFTTPLAKLGDSYRWQVLGEYTAKLDIPEAAVYLHSLGL